MASPNAFSIPNAQWATYQSFTVDLAALKADGSGMVMTPRSPSRKTWFFEFEAGHGARKIRWGSLGGMCRWVFNDLLPASHTSAD